MEVHSSQEILATMRGKVVVLTGGAQGIGAATVTLAVRNGAHVFFGDWDEDKGKALEASLKKETAGTATFVRVDVRDYASQLALFAAAYAAYGRIDTAVPLAAGGEPRGFFEPDTLTIDAVRQTPPTAISERFDLNVVSVLSFCRIALAYMRNPDPAAAARDAAAKAPLPKSLVLIASSAGIGEHPGVPVYVASKHAIMGLLRSFSVYAPVRYGVRVNAMCPSATNTRMIDSLADTWTAAGLPMNEPEDVARMILTCAADTSLNGAALYISGGRTVDVEHGYMKTMPQWMGETHAKEYWTAREFSGMGDGWVETKTSWQEK